MDESAPKGSGEQKNGYGPRCDADSRHEQELAEWNTQKTGSQVGRKPRAWNQTATEQEPCASFGKPQLALGDARRIQKLSRPRTIQNRTAKYARDEIEQRVANPDSKEAAEETRCCIQAPRSGEQGRADGGCIFLDKREDRERGSLHNREPFVESKGEFDGRVYHHSSIWQQPSSDAPRCSERHRSVLAISLPSAAP